MSQTCSLISWPVREPFRTIRKVDLPDFMVPRLLVRLPGPFTRYNHTMASLMRAARFYGSRDVRVEQVPRPIPGGNEVLVRVRAVTICPSDWRLYVDGHAGGVVPDQPIIQGHEFAGDVAEVGSSVRDVAVGTRVAVEPSWACGECDMCQAGRGNICRRVRFPSFPPVDGALAEYVACPAEAVYPLPDALTYEEGALTEPLGVSLHAVKLAGLTHGQSVALLGAGVIGLGVLRLALLHGCQDVAVVEPQPERRRLPGDLGALQVVAHCDDLKRQGYEADVVFECSGDNAALDQAVRLARPGGKVVVVGIPRDERITFDMSIARRHELTVLFARRSWNAVPEALRLLVSREVDFRALPLRFFPLDQVVEALELTGHPGPVLRAVVTP